MVCRLVRPRLLRNISRERSKRPGFRHLSRASRRFLGRLAEHYAFRLSLRAHPGRPGRLHWVPRGEDSAIGTGDSFTLTHLTARIRPLPGGKHRNVNLTPRLPQVFACQYTTASGDKTNVR